MKYFRLFKAKKSFGELSKSERRDFASEVASNILENIVQTDIRNLAESVKGVTPQDFNHTKDDFSRICKTREILKTIEQDTLDKEFEKLSLEFLRYLNSVRVIQERNLVEISTRYLTLNWIDKSIHKRSLDIYNRLLEIRSTLRNSNLWDEDLEATYKSTSYGKAGSKPSTFVSCTVLIKQKDKSKLFNSTWDREFWPVLNSDTFADSTESGSVKIWNAITNGMVPDLTLLFREFSEWLNSN